MLPTDPSSQRPRTTTSTMNSVAGPGLAFLPVPTWARFARTWIALTSGISGLLSVAALNDWSWLVDGPTATQALWACAAAVALGAGFGLPYFTRALNPLLGLRRTTNKDTGLGALVYGGHLSLWRSALLLSSLFGLTILTFTLGQQVLNRCPLPWSTRREAMPLPQPVGDLMPFHFWDYAIGLNPRALANFDLVLPYEKGPPQKLIGRIALQQRNTTGALVGLELHGKRPRTYGEAKVFSLFPAGPEAIESKVDLPRMLSDGRALAALSREAGLSASSTLRTLALTRFEHHDGDVTWAVGLPWSLAEKHFFFWGPQGSVFQVRCGDSQQAPCLFTDELTHVRFAPDPKASLGERKAWTTARLQSLLAELSAKRATASIEERRRQETIISLYIASLLTLDPRDPEAYFHLGKMAHNRETILAALKYGRDVGMEAAKLAELQAEADRKF